MGRTREIAVFPPGADIASFLWRVSVAEVDSAAPFSTFPGVDRHIALLEGAGFTMTLDGGSSEHRLHEPFMPFAFPGEASVDVALANGPTRDFNLMLRRGKARGRVDVWRAGVRHPLDGVSLVYVARGEVETPDGLLRAGDAWLYPPPVGETMFWQGDTVALAVFIELAKV